MTMNDDMVRTLIAELASLQRLAIAAEMGEVDAHEAARELAERLAIACKFCLNGPPGWEYKEIEALILSVPKKEDL